MPITFNPLINNLPTQRTDATQAVQPAPKTRQIVEAAPDQATQPKASTQLQLKGFNEVESLAWLQTTDAALQSGTHKLQTASEQLGHSRADAEQTLDSFAELTRSASFQGQSLFSTQSPALDTLTNLGENPPYFMASSGDAVDLFRNQLAEKLEAELQDNSQGVPLGEALASDIRQQLAPLMSDDQAQHNQPIKADFAAQGLNFHLEGHFSAEPDQPLHLDKNSRITTEVNGTELMLEGPFIRLLGPTSSDELQLPKKADDQAPQVAVDMEALVARLANPEQRQALDNPSLHQRLNEAIGVFEEIRQQLNPQFSPAFSPPADQPLNTQPKAEVDFAEAKKRQIEAAETYAREPWLALQTHAHATPDLVLNTIAE